LYDAAFSFWKLLAGECERLSGTVALANSEAPLLLSNAVWYPEPGSFSEVAAWYAERDLPAALVVPAQRGEALERTLREGFGLERAFSFLPLTAPNSLSGSYAEVVEQVSWAQGRVLGEVIAAHYGLPEYDVALGGVLTRVMQAHPNVTGYLAYAEGAVGAMVVYEAEGTLAAMLLAGAREALEARLMVEAQEQKLDAYVLEALGNGITARDARSLERWSFL